MPKPYPSEFRDDVVRVARKREPGVTIEQIAKDFGVHSMTLQKWLRRAEIDDGAKPGQTRTEAAVVGSPGRSPVTVWVSHPIMGAGGNSLTWHVDI
ncbi:transposase, partial [Nesterenkonia aurantiaca]